MRADLERAMLRRRAQEIQNPIRKGRMLRQVAEMAETVGDHSAFSTALKEYEAHVRANPGCEPGDEMERGAA